MLYPVAIDREEGALGVRVPDIPGCFSGGDNYQDALTSAKEAIESHIELLVKEGDDMPAATNIERWLNDPQYEDAMWALVDVDVVCLMGGAEKINQPVLNESIRNTPQRQP